MRFLEGIFQGFLKVGLSSASFAAGESRSMFNRKGIMAETRQPKTKNKATPKRSFRFSAENSNVDKIFFKPKGGNIWAVLLASW